MYGHECFNALQNKETLWFDMLLLKFPDRHVTYWWIAPGGNLTRRLTSMQSVDNLIKHGMTVE